LHLKTAPEIFNLTADKSREDERTRFQVNIGGRVEEDAAAFGTSGKLDGFDDGIALRRLDIIARGMFQFIVPIDFKVETGYIPGQLYIKDAYLLFPYISYLGRPEIGYFQPPMGLDLITSSRDIAFLEPAAPLQALAPGNEAGIKIGHPVFNERATWAAGLFGNGPRSSEYGNASKDYGEAISRITWLAIDHLHPDDPAINQSLHFGLSADYQYSPEKTVEFRARPESYIAPYVLDTGEIHASNSNTVGAEAAWVKGPLSVQGEFLDTLVQVSDSSSANFYGFYVSANYFLTGESHNYDRQNAAFSRVIPNHDFSFHGGGMGAVEVGCRYSFTDLTDGGIRGGRLGMLMGDVNWYLQPHVKLMFDGGYGNVSASKNNGDIFLLETRLAIDF
jgi:phosphate-selective porin OprO/OprP